MNWVNLRFVLGAKNSSKYVIDMVPGDTPVFAKR